MGDDRVTKEGGRFRGNELRIVRSLGSGSFGDTFLVENEAGEAFVVKRARSSRTWGGDSIGGPTTQAEGNASRLTSEHVVKLYDTWREPDDDRPCMLMEYCDGGDMEAVLRTAFPLPECTTIALFAQLLIGLDHTHLRHILHRDVKLENVLLHGGSWTGDRMPTAKISDFGLSKSLLHTDSPATARMGTLLYLSPELLGGRRYTRKTDVWSMGVAFYRILTNKMPFNGADMVSLTQAVLSTEPEHPSKASGTQYSPALGDVVLRMLNKSRSARPTARDVLASGIFTTVFSSWPWKLPAFTNCVGVFACRRRAVVNVRAEPSLESEKVGALRYGDQLYVRRSVVPSTGPDDTQLLWFQVVGPAKGFCLLGHGEDTFFQLFQNPARTASVLDSPSSTDGGDSSVTSLSCSVDPALISPLFRTI